MRRTHKKFCDVLLILCFIAGIGAHYVYLDDSWLYASDIKAGAARVTDGKTVKKLEWISLNGELPGTYREYLKEHPPSQSFFTKSVPGSENSAEIAIRTKAGRKFSILVEHYLYEEIRRALIQYTTDLKGEGYLVSVDTIKGGTPEQVRTWLQEEYSEGCCGVLLIGEIPVAWLDVGDGEFPSDVYYMDLDGSWEDPDSDGIYEVHTSGTGDEAPEIFVGRLYTSSLQFGTEAQLIIDYLEKVHRYRTGELTQDWRALEYLDEDWFNLNLYLDVVYDKDVTRSDLGYLTTADDYMAELARGYHFVQLCAHSYSGGHYFGTRPTEAVVYAHVYVYSPSDRQAVLLAGTDERIKIWLNGETVSLQPSATAANPGWDPDRFSAVVSLDHGWNQLLVKTDQSGGDYLFSTRLTDTLGRPIPGLRYQLNDPAIYSPEASFIRGWLVSTFHPEHSSRFWYLLNTNYLGQDEGSVEPYDGLVSGDVSWSLQSVGAPYIDLDRLQGHADFGVSYAYCQIWSYNDISCQLWLGYDDGARVWLNGKEILYDNRFGRYEPDMTRLNVSLKSGVNRLLLKVTDWTGKHGFSARFCENDGSPIYGLTYAPPPPTIRFIGTWLLSGPFMTETPGDRLEIDFLNGEAAVRPNFDKLSGDDQWTLGIDSGEPFDLGSYYDYGSFVMSSDIQFLDPPVFFYNLFACGPGRFTDPDYLAGAYLFNTTYGLAALASSKAGSMLNPVDFYEPISRRKSTGQALLEWFDSQAPFEQWEREWYYGLMLFGDPTLRIQNLADFDGDGCVNFIDLNLLLLHYGKDNGGDLDGDLDTDSTDLGILLNLWTGDCD